MTRLLENVDLSHKGRVKKAMIAASQLDWKELQQRNSERWSALVRHTFGALDTDHDGLLKASDIIEVCVSEDAKRAGSFFATMSSHHFHDLMDCKGPQMF